MGDPVSSDDILLHALGILQLRRITIVETNICRIRRRIAANGATARTTPANDVKNALMPWHPQNSLSEIPCVVAVFYFTIL